MYTTERIGFTAYGGLIRKIIKSQLRRTELSAGRGRRDLYDVLLISSSSINWPYSIRDKRMYCCNQVGRYVARRSVHGMHGLEKNLGRKILRNLCNHSLHPD